MLVESGSVKFGSIKKDPKGKPIVYALRVSHNRLREANMLNDNGECKDLNIQFEQGKITITMKEG